MGCRPSTAHDTIVCLLTLSTWLDTPGSATIVCLLTTRASLSTWLATPGNTTSTCQIHLVTDCDGLLSVNGRLKNRHRRGCKRQEIRLTHASCTSLRTLHQLRLCPELLMSALTTHPSLHPILLRLFTFEIFTWHWHLSALTRQLLRLYMLEKSGKKRI